MTRKQLFGAFLTGAMALGIVAISSTAGYSQRYGYPNSNNNRSYDSYPNWGGTFDLRQTALNAGYNEGTSAGQKDRNRGRRSNLNDFSEYRSASKDYSSRLGDRGLYQRYFRLAFERGYSTEMGDYNNGYNGGYNNGGYNNGGYNNGGYNNGGYNNGGYNNGGYNNGGYNNGGYNNGGYNNGGYNNGSWDRNNRWGRDWDRYGNWGGSSNFRQTALNAGYNQGIKEGRNDRRRGPRSLNDFSSYRNADTDYNSRLGDRNLYQRYYRQGFENGYYDGLNGY